MNRIFVQLLVLSLAACAAPDPQVRLVPEWKPVLGVGNDLCGLYVAQVRADPAARERYNQWLFGYVSAGNALASTITDVLGVNELNVTYVADFRDKEPARWLDNYCVDHLGAPFYVAARELIAYKIYLTRYQESYAAPK